MILQQLVSVSRANMRGPHKRKFDKGEILEELVKIDINGIKGDLDSLKKHARNLSKALAGKIPQVKVNADSTNLIAYLTKYLPTGTSLKVFQMCACMHGLAPCSIQHVLFVKPNIEALAAQSTSAVLLK